MLFNAHVQPSNPRLRPCLSIECRCLFTLPWFDAYVLLIEHMDCLAYAVQHGCEVSNYALSTAVSIGNLACVKLLVPHGDAWKPYLHRDTECLVYMDPAVRSIRSPFGPEQMRCLEHILCTGRPIHRWTLIWAARNGDVNLVRFLHRRGVPLWAHAWEEDPFHITVVEKA
jgi:hypothetical protein